MPPSPQQQEELTIESCLERGISREYCEYAMEERRKTAAKKQAAQTETPTLSTSSPSVLATMKMVDGKECLDSEGIVFHYDSPSTSVTPFSLFGEQPARELSRILHAKGYSQSYLGEEITGVNGAGYWLKLVGKLSEIHPELPHLFLKDKKQHPPVSHSGYEVMLIAGENILHDETVGKGIRDSLYSKGWSGALRQAVEAAIPYSCKAVQKEQDTTK